MSRLSNDGVEDDDEVEDDVEGVADEDGVEGDVDCVVGDCAHATTGTLKTTRNDARQRGFIPVSLDRSGPAEQAANTRDTSPLTRNLSASSQAVRSADEESTGSRPSALRQRLRPIIAAEAAIQRAEGSNG